MLNFLNLQGYKSYWVKFGDSCQYNFGDSDQMDINKLFGISSGLHHQNSARFGWLWNIDKISLHSYCYIQGERKSRHLTDLQQNKWYKLSVFTRSGFYIFEVEDESAKLNSVSIENHKKFRWGYNLWPYFGGNKKAPHDIVIEMEDFDPYLMEKI